MPGARTRALVGEALALRSWMRALLLDAAEADPPAASIDAWQLCLRQERCSALLDARVSARTLPADVRALLSGLAQREAKQMLAMRDHLLEVRRIADEHELRVLILKSGVEIAAGRPVYLADLDVLCTPADAQTLTGALDAAGYSVPQAVENYHLPPRVRAGTAIEVHTSVAGFDGPDDIPWNYTQGAWPQPSLAASPRLLRFDPPEHVWTLLAQVVLKHPDRAVRLRDMLLIRAAYAECSEAGLDRLQRRINSHRFAAAFRQVLAFALDSETPAERATATRIYLMRARTRAYQKRIGPRTSEHLIMLAAEGWRRRLRAQWFGWAQEQRSLPEKLFRTPVLAAGYLAAGLLLTDAGKIR